MRRYCRTCLVTTALTLITLAPLESGDGPVYVQKIIRSLTPNWKPYRFSLKANATDPKARLVISASQLGTFLNDAGAAFRHTFPANSVTVLRLRLH